MPWNIPLKEILGSPDPHFEFKGFWTPVIISNSRVLTATQKDLLALIYGFLKHNKYFSHKNYTISNHLGIAETTIRKHLNELKEMGFIEIDLQRGNSRSITMKKIKYISQLERSKNIPRCRGRFNIDMLEE